MTSSVCEHTSALNQQGPRRARHRAGKTRLAHFAADGRDKSTPTSTSHTVQQSHTVQFIRTRARDKSTTTSVPEHIRVGGRGLYRCVCCVRCVCCIRCVLVRVGACCCVCCVLLRVFTNRMA